MRLWEHPGLPAVEGAKELGVKGGCEPPLPKESEGSAQACLLSALRGKQLGKSPSPEKPSQPSARAWNSSGTCLPHPVPHKHHTEAIHSCLKSMRPLGKKGLCTWIFLSLSVSVSILPSLPPSSPPFLPSFPLFLSSYPSVPPEC